MDNVWMFSLSVTIINFIGFAFVAVAYIAVMMKVAKRMDQKSQKRAKEKGIFLYDFPNQLDQFLSCSD